MTTSWKPFLAVAVVCLGTVPVEAQKDAPAKPLGVWTRTIEQFSITFDIKAEGMKIILKAEGNMLTAHADYSVTKDGVLFGRMNKIERMGIDDGPAEGDLFSFKFKVTGAEMMLDDLQGKANDDAKRLVQGAYKKADK